MATQNEKLTFSHNFNSKLFSDTFTTLRIWNPKRYMVGRVFDVWLTDRQPWGQAEVIAVKKTKLSQLNDWLCYLDTGYNLEETEKMFRTMYKNNETLQQTNDLALSYVLLKKIK